MNTNRNRGAQELESWLTFTGQSIAAFARSINLSPRIVQMYVAGTSTPKIAAADSIQRATGGKVRLAMWIEEGSEG